jgi:hypothetical protein
MGTRVVQVNTDAGVVQGFRSGTGVQGCSCTKGA